jgi:cellulose synthase operon protein C
MRMGRPLRLALLVGLAGLSGIAAAEHPSSPDRGGAFETAQLMGQQHGRQDVEVTHQPPSAQPLDRPAAPAPEAPRPIDTTPIWFHLKRHDLPAAEADMIRLQAEHPEWRAPADLRHALEVARLRAALTAGDAAELQRQASRSGPLDVCADADLAWALIAAGGPPGRDTLLSMAAQCHDPGVATGSMDRYLRGVPAGQGPMVWERLQGSEWTPPVRRVLDGFAAATIHDQIKEKSLPPDRLAALEHGVAVLRDADLAEALGWRELAAGRVAEAGEWFSRALAWGGGTGAREGLARARISLGQLDQAAAQLPADSQLRPVLADAFLDLALAAASRGEPFPAVAADIRKADTLGRKDGWEVVGWKLLDLGQSSAAVEAFAEAPASEGAIYGRVLATRAAMGGDAANALACEHKDSSNRLAAACADGLAERQLAAYQAGRYQETEQLGDRLAAVAPDHRGGRTLAAWSYLRDGQPQKAARLFGQLYDEQPDRDLAGGLADSLQASGQEAALTQRVARGDAVLRDIVDSRISQVAYDRKQFDLAARSAAVQAPLAGLGGWQTGSGFELRETNGQAGLGRMSIAAPRLFAQEMVDDLKIRLDLVGARVSSGTPSPSADFGHGFAPGGMSALSASDIWQPRVSVRSERPGWTVGMRLSSTPLAGPIEARPTAAVGVVRHADPLILSGTLFSESVAGSMLSFSGQRDPLSGSRWGRVTDSGASIQAIYLPAERISLALGAEAASLAGHNVAGNDRLAVRLDAAYDLRPDGLDHLRLGPFLSWAHFRRNLSFFTFGQGGYYSPESDRRAGFLADMLTKEGRSWQLEAKASASYAHAIEDTSPRFPLDASGPMFAGSRTDGLDRDLSLRASWLASDHLILSGFARYSEAPHYADTAVGVFLTIPFSARQGVFSVDLPDSFFAPFH